MPRTLSATVPRSAATGSKLLKERPRLVPARAANGKGAVAKGTNGRGQAARVAHDIHDSVLAAVMAHRLPPGTKLTEASLCGIFGVSRTIVRMALHRLAHEHVVDVQPNRGACVASPTPRDTREIFAARRAIEAAILPLAIERCTPVHLAKLRAHIRAEHSAQRREDRMTWIRLTGEFHIALARIAGNPILTRFLTELVTRGSLIVALYDPLEKVCCENGEHAALVELIAKKEAAKALRKMDQHLLAIESGLKLEQRHDEIDLARILARS
jgi:DNA-binding GntR family transcriptional regulator